jgi:DNA-binding NarL/FixJ family response regulator
MSEQTVVLLVDDEPWFSEALAFTLESRGFECVTATDMTSAVAALGEHLVTVLVTDIMMPGGPGFPKIEASEAGFHFIEFVQKNWPRLPIICLSVIGDQAKIASLSERGVRYLRKGETPLATAVEIITAVAHGRRIRL